MFQVCVHRERERDRQKEKEIPSLTFDQLRKALIERERGRERERRTFRICEIMMNRCCIQMKKHEENNREEKTKASTNEI